MPITRSSRDLSARVEIESHKHPNRFYRRTWWVALLFGIISLVYLAFEFARGEQLIFEGGDVALPHRQFENDCAKCHTRWAPLERLATANAEISSIDNAKCSNCHPGPEHNSDQLPTVAKLSCGKCHRDHQGVHHDLGRVADRLCVDCHGDMKQHTNLQLADGSERPLIFFDGIKSFDEHPEFAMFRVFEAKEQPQRGHKVLDVLGQIARDDAENHKDYVLPEGGTKRWQDKAAIRFNHSKHVQEMIKENGQRTDGGIPTSPHFRPKGWERLWEGTESANPNDSRRYVDLSQACQVCHEPDAERRYMKPINYEKHCGACHPLSFDNSQANADGTAATVPHATSAIVRGFLTDLYANRLIKKRSPPLRRRIPGRPVTERLTADELAALKQAVGGAETNLLQNPQQQQVSYNEAVNAAREAQNVVFAPGGCRYCHSITPQSGEGSIWQIVPPNIPDRWLPHSKFRHDSHRMLGCIECHKKFSISGSSNVDTSDSTGDVLIPKISLCRECHTKNAISTSSSTSARYIGARTDCVECHNYHQHTGEDFNGDLNTKLDWRRSDQSKALGKESSR